MPVRRMPLTLGGFELRAPGYAPRDKTLCADPAQENRCRDAGILIALNEVCGVQPLA
jgi:hypothetical protein